MNYDHPALSPHDEHNQRLAANVHPAEWTNPTANGPYNLVVIGAGTAGLVAASGANGMGAKVALIERDLMGGDCLNVGCVPSKGLISAARVAAAVRDSADFGVQNAGAANVDFAAVMERMRRLRAGISPHDSAKRFSEMGVDVYLGEAAFVDEKQIEVDGQRLQFSRALIATGGRAKAPSIPGLEKTPYLTNETLFSLTELPRRLGVIGGGPIGAEMAQTFARFGSETHLLTTQSGLLPKDDRDAATIVQATMQRDGVVFHDWGRDVEVNYNDQHGFTLLKSNSEERIEVDQLLVAVGRAPNVETLNLGAAGVAFDASGVEVNERLQTTNSRIYAAGDVCSRYKFTHAADFMARLVIQNALFLGRAKVDDLMIPWATYTSPEVAQIGLTKEQAEQQGQAVDVYDQPFDKVDRAILDGQTEGFVRVLCKQGTDSILGATIVAEHAGELISPISIAMKGKIGLKKIANAIHPYPTQAEAIRKLGDQFNRTRLTPFFKSLAERWLRWRR